jgi:hypothetical protein
VNAKWIGWAQRLQAIAQTGPTFTENPFEVERYEQVREIAAEMMGAISRTHSELDVQPIRDLFIARFYEHYRHPDWETDFD